jgi:hypothetical protein
LDHREAIFLTLANEDWKPALYVALDLRQAVQNSLDSFHVPNPPAFAVWTALAERFRKESANLVKQIAICALVIVRRDDLRSFSSGGQCAIALSEQVRLTNPDCEANSIQGTTRMAL